MHDDKAAEFFQVRLPARLHSALAARQLLGDAARRWGASDQVSADAALALSELVTNSVLHAGTPVDVAVSKCGSGVRIEVSDGSASLPDGNPATLEDLVFSHSTTGRGLALVATLSERWGAEQRGRGKVVWAEVGCSGRPAGKRPRQGPPRRSHRGRPARRSLGEGVAVVRMVGVPTRLIGESARHLADLHRELTFVRLTAGDAGAPSPVPPSSALEAVSEAASPWLDNIESWAESERNLADHSVGERVDFEVIVPAGIGPVIEGVAAWLEQAALPTAGRRLLTGPPSAEVVRYRCWYRDEILAQMAGCPPRRCPF